MMMKKSYSDKKLQDVQKKIKSNQKWLKKRAIIFALFVFTVNIYAWFVYFTKANVNVEASVLSWNLNFFDSNEKTNNVNINPGAMYPGMTEYIKEIEVKNSSEVKATFDYEIIDINILGVSLNIVGKTKSELTTLLRDDYPFSIDISTNKSILDESDTAKFILSVNWDYDKNILTYYKLTNQYLFDSSISYYVTDGTNYTVDSTVTATNFNSKVTSGIYLEKDDADSFWGSKCKQYETDSGKSCVNVKLKLIAQQKE